LKHGAHLSTNGAAKTIWPTGKTARHPGQYRRSSCQRCILAGPFVGEYCPRQRQLQQIRHSVVKQVRAAKSPKWLNKRR
jgi:hypothetical protein